MCQIENVYEMDSTDFLHKIKERLLFLLRNPADFTAITIRRLKKSKTHNIKNAENQHQKKFTSPSEPRLNKGDIVKIRSINEIQKTLDKKNKLEGCLFMEEMGQYCGSQQKILKRVEYFYDEANSRMCKARNIVLLEGLYCSGKGRDKPNCDRSCLYFWKEDWLEKIK